MLVLEWIRSGVGQAEAMDPARLPAPGAVATWSKDPLVVTANLDGAGAVKAVLRLLRAAHPGVGFVTVLSVATVDDLGPVLRTFAPVMAERVFTATVDGTTARADVLARAALEQYGVGQDFVFEVSPVAQAVGYALRALSGDAGVEGTGLLIIGSSQVLAEARGAWAARIPPAAP